MKRKVGLIVISVLAILAGADSALASEGAADGGLGLQAIGAAIAIGLGAFGGTIGQSKALTAALEAIGRNPSASGKVFTPLVLGLALIESLVILAFVIAITLAG